MSHDRDRIRMLNDELRQQLPSGSVLITPGIVALGAAAFHGLLSAIVNFDDFNEDNDPYGEHDFGAFDFAGVRVFFKIDYLTRTATQEYLNPADPSQTKRMITIMTAQEY